MDRSVLLLLRHVAEKRIKPRRKVRSIQLILSSSGKAQYYLNEMGRCSTVAVSQTVTLTSVIRILFIY